MNWDQYIKQFKNYLRLERSLSDNSVEAYIHDVVKLKQFVELSNASISPLQVESVHLKDFLEYINDLGMTAHSQARIISGLKAFYKYLIYDELIDKDPTQLIEGPKLGRKLPDTLSYEEIVKLLEGIDHSKPEGQRNRAILEVLYSSGLRVSELVNLRLSNVYEDIGFLRIIGKGDKERLLLIDSD